MKIKLTFCLQLFFLTGIYQLAHSQIGKPISIGKTYIVLNEINAKTANKRVTSPKLDLKITNENNLIGIINHQESILNGAYIIGEIENHPQSTFYLKSSKDSLDGTIILQDTKKA